MTIEINGTPYTFLTGVEWREASAGQLLTGQPLINRQRTVILTGDVMTPAEFNTLKPLYGQVCTIKCCAYNADTNKVYAGCTITDLVAAQSGPNMIDVFIRAVVVI